MHYSTYINILLENRFFDKNQRKNCIKMLYKND